MKIWQKWQWVLIIASGVVYCAQKLEVHTALPLQKNGDDLNLSGLIEGELQIETRKDNKAQLQTDLSVSLGWEENADIKVFGDFAQSLIMRNTEIFWGLGETKIEKKIKKLLSFLSGIGPFFIEQDFDGLVNHRMKEAIGADGLQEISEKIYFGGGYRFNDANALELQWKSSTNTVDLRYYGQEIIWDFIHRDFSYGLIDLGDYKVYEQDGNTNVVVKIGLELLQKFTFADTDLATYIRLTKNRAVISAMVDHTVWDKFSFGPLIFGLGLSVSSRLNDSHQIEGGLGYQVSIAHPLNLNSGIKLVLSQQERASFERYKINMITLSYYDTWH